MPNRQEPRVPYRLPVSIGCSKAALSSDLSEQGFCLETPLPLSYEAGADIDGYVLFQEQELAFRGQVAWFEPGHPQASAWNRVGVQFTWLSPGLRALLRKTTSER